MRSNNVVRKFSVLMVFLLITGCATVQRPSERSVLAGLRVAPLRLEVVTIDGFTPALLETQERTLSLAGKATEATLRAALEQGLAENATSEVGAGEYLLEGTLKMPIALPPGLAGRRAAFRAGLLASLHLTLKAPSGVEVATAEAQLRWKDVRWTSGGPKQRRRRPIELVLVAAAEKAGERGIQELRQQLSSKARLSGRDSKGTGQ